MGDKADDRGANSELRGLSSYLDVSFLFPFFSLLWGGVAWGAPSRLGLGSPVRGPSPAGLGPPWAPPAPLLPCWGCPCWGCPCWGFSGGGALSPPWGGPLCLPPGPLGFGVLVQISCFAKRAQMALPLWLKVWF